MLSRHLDLMHYRMGSLGNWSLFLCIYVIISIHYSFCGASPLDGPSVEVAPLETFPFIVSLTNRYLLNKCKTAAFRYATEWAHFCGGSLITTSHILTAAHCVTPWQRFEDVVVKIGVTNLRTNDEVYDVSWWITLSRYHNIIRTYRNGKDVTDDIYDIAIIRLKKPVGYDFPLPTISYIPNSQLYRKAAVMAGWGHIEKNQKRPINMRIGKTFILGPEECSANLPDRSKEKHNAMYLCTDSSLAETGDGDSGSPLLYDGVNPDYPNNIVGVITENVDREEGAPHPVMDVHMSVFFSKEFIESVKNMTMIP